MEAAEFLRQHPQLAQHGVLLNTYELGDYLIWALHPRFRVMVASHAHLIPPDVWQDYIAISQRRPGWPARIEKYNLRVAVLNTGRHRQVIRDLVNEHRWQIAFRGRSASVVIHPDVTWP